MKKTNLRINNFFILIHDNKHYLTDIDMLDDWKNTKPNELKKYTENDDCSKKIVSLEDTNFTFIADGDDQLAPSPQKVPMESDNSQFQQSAKQQQMDSSYERLMAERQLIK